MKHRAGLIALLAAENISAIGSRMSFLAIPWLVLVTTGSPTKMGIVALAETLPFVLSGVLGAPLADRYPARLVAVVVDGSSALLVAGVAIFSRDHFLLLVLFSGLIGLVQGVGDKARRVLLQPMAQAAGASMPRVVTIYSSLSRLSIILGVSIGGILIAWLGPIGAVWVNSVSYSISAALIFLLVRIPAVPGESGTKDVKVAPKEPYVQALRGGYEFLRKDKLLLGLTWMMLVTNLFNQASGVVLVPLWVMRVLDSPIALGWISGAFALGSILGNIAFIGLITRLPRYMTFIIGYLIGGSPRFLVLAFTDNLAVVLGVTFVAGIAMSTINPTYGVLLFERVPQELQARVYGLSMAILYAGIPIGGLVGAWAVGGLGLSGALILSGAAYFAATMSPIVGYRVWKQMDDLPGDADRRKKLPELPHWWMSMTELANRSLPIAVTGLAQPPVTVRLAYADRQWTLSARSGRRTLVSEHEMPPAAVLQQIKVLELPELYEVVEQLHVTELAETAQRVRQLRSQLADVETKLGGTRQGGL